MECPEGSPATEVVPEYDDHPSRSSASAARRDINVASESVAQNRVVVVIDGSSYTTRPRCLHQSVTPQEPYDRRERSRGHAVTTPTARDVAAQIREILDAVDRGEFVGQPGLVARLEGAALALKALAEARQPGR
jgi:hypothetical protein